MEYQIIRSNRKTVAIQIRNDGQILVRCPKWMRTDEVRKFVASKESWIRKHSSRLQNRNLKPFRPDEIEEFRQLAKDRIFGRVACYADILGVNYQRITIRTQKTRWGSCSGKGTLSFNCLLALVPTEVLDYVVVHELCHLKEMNHSQRFWQEVQTLLPDYMKSRRWLKDNGRSLIARLP